MGDDPVPVLDYAPPDPGEVPFLHAMRRSRQIAGWGLLLTFPAGYLQTLWPTGPVLAIPPLAMLCIGGICALVFMTRAAARELGGGYAMRQLLLATLLLPILFAGVFLITRLVEADLHNNRLAQRPDPDADPARAASTTEPHFP